MFPAMFAQNDLQTWPFCPWVFLIPSFSDWEYLWGNPLLFALLNSFLLSDFPVCLCSLTGMKLWKWSAKKCMLWLSASKNIQLIYSLHHDTRESGLISKNRKHILCSLLAVSCYLHTKIPLRGCIQVLCWKMRTKEELFWTGKIFLQTVAFQLFLWIIFSRCRYVDSTGCEYLAGSCCKMIKCETIYGTTQSGR